MTQVYINKDHRTILLDRPGVNNWVIKFHDEGAGFWSYYMDVVVPRNKPTYICTRRIVLQKNPYAIPLDGLEILYEELYEDLRKKTKEGMMLDD